MSEPFEIAICTNGCKGYKYKCLTNKSGCSDIVRKCPTRECTGAEIITVKEIEKKSSLDDLKFGTEVEVNGKLYNWCGKTKKEYVFERGGNIVFLISPSWNLPLKTLIKKGQPVYVGPKNLLRFVECFNREMVQCISNSIAWSEWRLPTEQELKDIGHYGKGWVSKGD